MWGSRGAGGGERSGGGDVGGGAGGEIHGSEVIQNSSIVEAARPAKHGKFKFLVI